MPRSYEEYFTYAVASLQVDLVRYCACLLFCGLGLFFFLIFKFIILFCLPHVFLRGLTGVSARHQEIQAFLSLVCIMTCEVLNMLTTISTLILWRDSFVSDALMGFWKGGVTALLCSYCGWEVQVKPAPHRFKAHARIQVQTCCLSTLSVS